MQRKTVAFLIFALVIVVLSAVIYFLNPYLQSYSDRFLTAINTISFDIAESNFKIINKSKYLRVSINDEKKLEQILRRYSPLLNEKDGITLIIEDSPQLFNFGWGNGDAFGYSFQDPESNRLIISMKIDLDVLQNYNWDLITIAGEAESLFINSLERATLNLDITKSDTRSEAEENEKANAIDESALNALYELNGDNNTELFKVKIL